MSGSTQRRLRAIMVSIIVLAFIAGISAGILGTKLLTPSVRIRSSMDDMSAVFDRLGLTPEQRAQATEIASRSAPRSREIMLELGERLKSVADSVDAELRAILTPAQRLVLDSLRRDSRLLLKRKVMTPGGQRVDTLLDTSAAKKME
jgi:hypothetical protein